MNNSENKSTASLSFSSLFYSRKLDQISYLIFESNIPKSKEIKKLLKNNHTVSDLSKLALTIEDLFSIREDNNKLVQGDHNKEGLIESLSTKLNNALIHFCAYDKIEPIKYVLTSPDLVIHANIHGNKYKKDYPLANAFLQNHWNIVDYLLYSNDLKEHADINSASLIIIKNAITYKHPDTIKKLIFDYNIQVTQEIDDFLTNSNLRYPREICQQIREMFEIKKTNDELNSELKNNNLILKPNKI